MYSKIKKQPFKLALVMIVKPSDDEAELLKRCLASVAQYVDGIFLTITGENAKCEEVAKFFNATVSHFPWVNSFAKARNFALSQVPKDYDYWMWLDCDDVLRGGEFLRKVIENHPGVDAFVFNYLYHFDEYRNPDIVHMKTRVLRHDGCVEWAGDLHEDFKQLRAIDAFFVESIDVLHLSNDGRYQQSKERNVEVSEASAKDYPDDPRTYWNLGNSYQGIGRYDDALVAFTRFMQLSQSEEEKYLIYLRMAEIYIHKGQNQKAMECASLAIGTRPHYPDAYFFKGQICFHMEQYHEAIDYYKQSLSKEPPYHKIIVYNPRAYDYEPMIAMVKCYFKLGLPNLALPLLEGCLEIYPESKWLQEITAQIRLEAEKVNKVFKMIPDLSAIKDDAKFIEAFEKIDPSLRAHPALGKLYNSRIVKKESSGRDLVIYCGFTEEVWSPETARTKGIGGSEEAVIHISKNLAKMGWNVEVYSNCGHQVIQEDGVTYKPFWMYNNRNKQDVTILWRSFRLLSYDINSTKIFVDLHDVMAAGELNEKRMSQVTKVFVKSKAHRDLFPAVPDDKFAIIPNGIVWQDLQDQTIERDPYLIVNTSSPDRSLKALLECFAEVKKAVPQARLEWAYGWGVFDTVHSNSSAEMAWKNEILAMIEKTPGVKALGRVSHGEVAKMYQRATVFGYPTAFFEIDCISARKAQAGGAAMAVTDFGALQETVQFGHKIHVDAEQENWGKPHQFDFSLQDPRARKEWIDACIFLLKHPPTAEQLKNQREWTKQFDWTEIAKRWHSVLTE